MLAHFFQISEQLFHNNVAFLQKGKNKAIFTQIMCKCYAYPVIAWWIIEGYFQKYFSLNINGVDFKIQINLNLMSSQHSCFQRQTLITIWIKPKDWNSEKKLLLGSPVKLQSSCVVSPICCIYCMCIFTNSGYVTIALFSALKSRFPLQFSCFVLYRSPKVTLKLWENRISVIDDIEVQCSSL